MMHVYARQGRADVPLDDPATIWIDLEDPSAAEEAQVESTLGIDVPTPFERAAFEESARFYEDNGALYMTATLLGRRDDGPFVTGAVTFILLNQTLVTVRQIRPRAFEVGRGRASARVHASASGAQVALALMEGSIERLADFLAELSHEANAVAAPLFSDAARTARLRGSLKDLGRIVIMTALAHESLSSLQRLTAFAHSHGSAYGLDAAKLAMLSQDVAELEGLAEALQARVSYMQDASLGLINAHQAEVLKALSVAAMAFIPPTLVASIFGMNFESMSWFQASWGPWLAFAFMLLAPTALFSLAKWRRWFR